MGKSIAKFIMMSTAGLLLAFIGVWIFNHVNAWIGILWLVGFVCGTSYYWGNLMAWVFRSNNQQKENNNK